MARTPDVAGALEAVVARTLKSTLGPKLRKLDGQMRRLEKKLRKIGLRRAAAGGRKKGTRAGRRPMARRRRGGRRGRR